MASSIVPKIKTSKRQVHINTGLDEALVIRMDVAIARMRMSRKQFVTQALEALLDSVEKKGRGAA